MVLWDCLTTTVLEEEEIIDEKQILGVNITTRSQIPITDEILLPNIKKFQEIMKKIANKTQNPPIPEKVIAKQKTQAVIKPTKIVENN